MLDIFGGIAHIVTGVYATNKGTKLADEWLRFGASLMGTVLVTFLGVFGATGLASLIGGSSWGVAIAYALFSGALASAAGVFTLWTRSPLMRGIPLWAPRAVVEESLSADGTYVEPGKK